MAKCWRKEEHVEEEEEEERHDSADAWWKLPKRKHLHRLNISLG